MLGKSLLLSVPGGTPRCLDGVRRDGHGVCRVVSPPPASPNPSVSPEAAGMGAKRARGCGVRLGRGEVVEEERNRPG